VSCGSRFVTYMPRLMLHHSSSSRCKSHRLNSRTPLRLTNTLATLPAPVRSLRRWMSSTWRQRLFMASSMVSRRRTPGNRSSNSSSRLSNTTKIPPSQTNEWQMRCTIASANESLLSVCTWTYCHLGCQRRRFPRTMRASPMKSRSMQRILVVYNAPTAGVPHTTRITAGVKGEDVRVKDRRGRSLTQKILSPQRRLPWQLPLGYLTGHVRLTCLVHPSSLMVRLRQLVR
jgi:hypothetical protein